MTGTPLDDGPHPQAADEFDADMRRGLFTLKRELNYNAARFAQMLATYGGVATAQRLLKEDGYHEGFTTLWERGRLDMSVEFFVLLPWYAPLFDDDVRDRARRRLTEHRFDVDAHLRTARRNAPEWWGQ